MASGLKQEVLFRLYPGIKVKVVGEDEINEEDIAEWKASRKERIKAEEEAKRLAEEAKNAPPEEQEDAEAE